MAEITSRERVNLVLNHQEADRIPFDLGTTCFTTIHREVAKEINQILGVSQNQFDYVSFSAQVVKPAPEVSEHLHIDTVGVSTKMPSSYRMVLETDDSYTDEWGIRYRRAPNAFQYDFIFHPFQEVSLEEMLEYEFPDPADDTRFDGLKEYVKALYEKTDKAIILNTPCSLQIMALGQWLTGFQRFYMDTVVDHEFVHALSDRIISWYKRWLDRALNDVGKYISVIVAADDLGIQTGPMINPKTYRELYKPYHKELFRYIKQGTDAKIFFHCCGSITQFMDDIIEVGVDVLNPVQVTAVGMDSDKLKAGWGDKLTFWGGGCAAQTVLANGTVEDVREDVRRRVSDFKPGGGFVFAPIHNVLPGVSGEKVLAMYETAWECGKY